MASILNKNAVPDQLIVLYDTRFVTGILAGMVAIFFCVFSCGLFVSVESMRNDVGKMVKVFFIVSLLLPIIVGTLAGLAIAVIDEQADAIEDLYD